LSDYLDKLVAYGVLRYDCFEEEGYYSANLRHPFVQRLIKSDYFESNSAMIEKGVYDELKVDDIWKRLGNNI